MTNTTKSTTTKKSNARESKVQEERTEREYTRKPYSPPQLSRIPDEVEQRFKEKGYKLRWLRWCDPDGKIESNYLLQRKQEGYEFVHPDDVPEMNLFESTLDDKLGTILTQKDLALAKVRIEDAEDRQKWFENQARMKEGTFIRDYKNSGNRHSRVIDKSESKESFHQIAAPRGDN